MDTKMKYLNIGHHLFSNYIQIKCGKSKIVLSFRGVWGKMPSFSFPASKFALWNPAPIGESTVSHLSYR